MPIKKSNNNLDWNYDIEGEGQTLLFIHGWGVDRRIWRQQLKHFSQYYKVLSVDLPGHGESSWHKVRLDVMAQDIKEILECENICQVIIVGSSLGGMLALKMYDLFPAMIERLIFVGSIPKFAKSQDYPYGLDVARIRKLNTQLNSDYPGVINVFFRSLFTKEERSTRRYKWLQKFRRTDKSPVKQALVEYLDIIENEDLRHVLKKVTIPTQFINGTDDYICNHGAVDYLKKLSPNAQFYIFDKCGHFPFLSKPHEFNEVLENFLKQEM